MQELLESKFPTVAAALDRVGVSLACVSSSWLLCAFANALPWTTLLRTWDVLLFPPYPNANPNPKARQARERGEGGEAIDGKNGGNTGGFLDSAGRNDKEKDAHGRDLLLKFTLALVDIHAQALIASKEPTQLIILLQSMAVQVSGGQRGRQTASPTHAHAHASYAPLPHSLTPLYTHPLPYTHTHIHTRTHTLCRARNALASHHPHPHPHR